MSLRTHTCGELAGDSAGRKVTLCGWVENSRDHGGVLFIDLRDRYGRTQALFNPTGDRALYDRACKLGAETVVRIEGTVRRRKA